MSRALTWIAVALLVAVAGGGIWLIVAPYVVGYQPNGGDWTLATRADLVAGAVVLGVSLLTLGGYLAASLRAGTREGM